MYRALAMLLVMCSPVLGQLSYVSGSGLSFSSSYVGDSTTPTPGTFDQDDDFGTVSTDTLAEWEGDGSWADASLSTTFFDYVQATAGHDNTTFASTGNENAAWSTASQDGTWNTGGQPVTYTFTLNLAISDETITGNTLFYSADNFLDGEATAGDFKFEWVLDDGAIIWTLTESGYVIDFGVQGLFFDGTNWVSALNKSVTDSSPAATETISAETNSSSFFSANWYYCRSGEAQTGVIITD